MKTIFCIAFFALFTCACAQRSKETQLIVAAGRGDVPRIEQLLTEGVDVNCVSHGLDRSTPLIWAVSQVREKAVSVLLTHGANPNIVDAHKKPPLFYAFSTQTDFGPIIKDLILAGAKTDNYKDLFLSLEEKNPNRIAFGSAIKLRTENIQQGVRDTKRL